MSITSTSIQMNHYSKPFRELSTAKTGVIHARCRSPLLARKGGAKHRGDGSRRGNNGMEPPSHPLLEAETSGYFSVSSSRSGPGAAIRSLNKSACNFGQKHTSRYSRRLSAGGVVYEGVNELQSEKSDVPSSAEEGWMRDKKEAKPPNTRRRGGAGQIPS